LVWAKVDSEANSIAVHAIVANRRTRALLEMTHVNDWDHQPFHFTVIPRLLGLTLFAIRGAITRRLVSRCSEPCGRLEP
jgi:hypothetical protein